MARVRKHVGEANSRSLDPSRRLLLSATTAVLLVGDHADASTDPVATACAQYLARHAEHERLGLRWQQIESRLFSQHDWSKLNRRQRKRYPEKHEMDDLSDRMDALHDENCALLASLPSIVARTPPGICGKLSVAALEVCPEDHPVAHQLIASILRDYRALHRV